MILYEVCHLAQTPPISFKGSLAEFSAKRQRRGDRKSVWVYPIAPVAFGGMAYEWATPAPVEEWEVWEYFEKDVLTPDLRIHVRGWEKTALCLNEVSGTERFYGLDGERARLYMAYNPFLKEWAYPEAAFAHRGERKAKKEGLPVHYCATPRRPRRGRSI
jgi:hypothetical protein